MTPTQNVRERVAQVWITDRDSGAFHRPGPPAARPAALKFEIPANSAWPEFRFARTDLPRSTLASSRSIFDLDQQKRVQRCYRGLTRTQTASTMSSNSNGLKATISINELKRSIRRNKLLGIWAAEKLGLTGPDAEAYSDALALDTLDPERSDVFSKIRKDFNAAGVVQSDDQILLVMNELMLQAGNQMPGTGGGALDAAAVMLARNLKSR